MCLLRRLLIPPKDLQVFKLLDRLYIVCSGKNYPIYSKSPLGNKQAKQKPWSLSEYFKSLVRNAMRYPDREGEMAGVGELILSQYIMGPDVRERGT